jgi:hypothetical protein
VASLKSKIIIPKVKIVKKKKKRRMRWKNKIVASDRHKKKIDVLRGRGVELGEINERTACDWVEGVLCRICKQK